MGISGQHAQIPMARDGLQIDQRERFAFGAVSRLCGSAQALVPKVVYMKVVCTVFHIGAIALAQASALADSIPRAPLIEPMELDHSALVLETFSLVLMT